MCTIIILQCISVYIHIIGVRPHLFPLHLPPFLFSLTPSTHTGIVSSSVMTTLMQVSSRVFIVWAVLELTPGVAENLGLLLVCYAWGITEVIRYSYYFFALVDAVPYPIKWCR